MPPSSFGWVRGFAACVEALKGERRRVAQLKVVWTRRSAVDPGICGLLGVVDDDQERQTQTQTQTQTYRQRETERERERETERERERETERERERQRERERETERERGRHDETDTHAKGHEATGMSGRAPRGIAAAVLVINKSSFPLFLGRLGRRERAG
jgi:hypothetical protein